MYFARLRVKGNLIRKRLKTDALSVVINERVITFRPG